MKKNRYIYLLGGIALIGGLFAFSSAGNPMAKPINSSRLRRSKYGNYAKWIEAMARHESGNYTSKIAKENNNIFGMGFPYSRPAANEGTTEHKIERQFMSNYKSYDQAIEDLLLWFDYNNFPTDLERVEDFAERLRMKGYYTDTLNNYTKALKKWL